MAWMSSSQPTPVVSTTLPYLRWCSASPWTTGSMTPIPVWWGKLSLVVPSFFCFGMWSHISHSIIEHPPPLSILQGWLSPGQVFVMDEYCARNGVRGCHRHLCYLGDLLERAENGAMIDPTLLHYSFAFCASHVHGNRYRKLTYSSPFMLSPLLSVSFSLCLALCLLCVS